MDKSYIQLFKEIYEAKDLRIEPLGIRFKDLSTDVISTILYPILDLKYEKLDITKEKIDSKRLKKVYEIYLRYQEQDLIRVGIITGDHKKAYEKLTNDGVIIEDEYNKTIVTEEETFITIKYDFGVIYRILRNYDVLVVAYSFNSVYHYNSIFQEGVIDNEIYNKRDSHGFLSLDKIPTMLFYILLNSMGLTHIEQEFLDIMTNIDTKHMNCVIEQCNSVFIKTFIVEFEKVIKHQRRKSEIIPKINYLLDNYRIDILKDLKFKDALKVYYKNEKT